MWLSYKECGACACVRACVGGGVPTAYHQQYIRFTFFQHTYISPQQLAMYAMCGYCYQFVQFRPDLSRSTAHVFLILRPKNLKTMSQQIHQV